MNHEKKTRRLCATKGNLIKARPNTAAGTIKIERSLKKGERETSVQGRSVVGEVITDDLETRFTEGVAVYL